MYKNYIFDFGDVFINLDKPAPKLALQELGLEDFTDEMSTVNMQYEKGLLITDDFIAFYQNQFPLVTRQELIDAWNSIILDFPIFRLEFIEEFSKNHHCYLLSNINDLHLECIKNNLGEIFYNRFVKCFKKVYYTHQIHLRKPDIAIFEYVFKDAKINPKDSFFIDDTIENIETAKTFGVTCWHINPLDDDVVLLEEILSV